MKKLFFVFLLNALQNIGFSQSKIIDSLSRELAVTTDDKHKIMLLSDISHSYRLSNPDTGFVLGRKALVFAQKIQFAQGESNALSSIGAIYRMIGDLQNAMSYQFESLHIAQKGNYENEIAKAYLGISNIYSDLRDFDVAINYGKLSYQIYSKLNTNAEQITTTLANIGEAYNRKNQLDSALYYLQLSYERALKGNEYVMPFCLTRLGIVNLKLKNYTAAYEYAQKAITSADKGKNIRSQCMINQILSEYYKATNKLDSSIYYAKIGFNIAKAYNYKWDMLDGSNALANLYESKNLKEAYYYTKLSKSLNDSLFGADRVNTLQKKLIKEQERVRENQAKVLAEQNLLKQTTLFIGLCIVGIIGFILYRNNRQKQKANALLQEQKEKVESTLTELKATQTQLIQKEKLASLGELTAGIAHEIQNPLNFVNNFSELSVDLAKELNEEMDKEPIDKELMKELMVDLTQNQEKINHHGKRASSIVKGMLEHSRASTGVKELTDINKLADEYLRLSYHGLRAKDKDFNATMETHFQDPLSKIEVIPQDIGRVLLNLINNAFYAVNERQQQLCEGLEPSQSLDTYTPSVSITTQQVNNQIIIKIKDNGTGMPESVRAKVFQPFFTTKPTGSGTGLGLSLAYDIVTKGHGGTLEVESTEGVGSEFIICLPLKTNG